MSSPSPSVVLGPFVLRERIGNGGMAEVWRGVHEGDAVQVAVKVLTEERARTPKGRLQFRQEARAMARLDHRHIVRVHDAGEVSEQAAEGSEGALVAGMPYLVMDLLPSGSLWQYRGRLRWSDLRNLLRVLLDALAHAHGKGVIHRDLKPANVLVSNERRAVISDFGIAHLPGETLLLRAGTPAYMAPEQFLDRWRDFGPWTDLYGFGCLVWTLIAGAPPFRRSSWDQTRDAHLREELPALVPLQPMPPGVEDWLRDLLVKDPARRTQCAADAIWALEQLEPGDLATRDPLADGAGAEESAGAMGPMESSTVNFGVPPAFTPTTPWSVGRNDAPPPPPDDWRGPLVPPRLHLRGAGLGVLGARTLPTVGRDAERDQLWTALVRVHRDPRAVAVVMEGAAGTGKTHLARWLAERAHEVGAASAMVAEHGSVGGQDVGLRGMLRDHFDVRWLEPVDGRARVAEVARGYGTIDERDQTVLSDMAVDELPSDDVVATTPERMAALARHLGAVGARRPVIVIIDDAHRGIDALVFVRWVLERRDTEPLPVLFVVVGQDEGFGQADPARELLAHICACDGVSRLRVGPLPDADQASLVRGLVGLEGELASRVVQRTRGNPAFAIALVEDWVARDQLHRGEGGFRLRGGAGAALPDDLHALWVDHLHAALADEPEGVWQALELAAVMGNGVDTEDWERLAKREGHDPSLEAVDRLVERRLLVAERPLQSWRFGQSMVRESLLRRAEEGGRIRGMHRAVLEELMDRSMVDEQRMARHLLGAGQLAEAVSCLVEAVRHLAEQGNPHAVLDLCEQAETAIADLPQEQAAHFQPLVRARRSQALMTLGRLSESQIAAEAVVRSAHSTDEPVFLAKWVLATLQLKQGQTVAARDRLSELVEELQPRKGPPVHLAAALRTMADTLLQLGDLEGALQVGRDAMRVAEEAQSWPTWAQATTQVARCLEQLGRMSEAADVADDGLAHRDAVSHPGAVASMLGVRATIDRRQGKPDRALARFEEALDLLDRVGSLDAVVPRTRLAAIHALAHRYSEALRLGERCRRETVLQRSLPLELAVRGVLLVAALGLGVLNDADVHATRILDLDTEGVVGDVDAYELLARGVQMLRGREDHRTADLVQAVVARWAEGPGRHRTERVAWLLQEDSRSE